jgi:hypothetical protein
MGKRTSLSERQEKDAKTTGGVDAYFAETNADTDANNKQTEEKPTPKKKGKKENQPVVDDSYLKASYYIRPEQDDNLLDIQKVVRQQTGERKDKSSLVREALDLLANRYGIKPNRKASKTA